MPGPKLTFSEVRQAAALLALEAVQRIDPPPDPDVLLELRGLEHWLRARAVNGDKITMRQINKPLGRQVRMPKGGPKR